MPVQHSGTYDSQADPERSQWLEEPDMSQWLKHRLERLDELDRLEMEPNPPVWKPWSPPEDPDKPNFPYLPGFTVGIHRHCNGGTELRAHLLEEYLKRVTHTESVVANPPTVENPSSVSNAYAGLAAQMTVTAPIAIGAARGPQVVACTVAPGVQKGREGEAVTTPFKAAAKIYDPLYYNFEEDIGDDPRDCAYLAEIDYRTETAAYEHLHSHGQTGSFAPEYHGAWTFELPITVNGEPRTRNVRLVLIELLDGTSIEATRTQNHPDKNMGKDSFHYPQEYRMEVLVRAMDGYVRQLQVGLCQRDLAGRNVILVADSNPRGEKVSGLVVPRIVLIDYNIAKVNRDLKADEVARLPLSPAAVFWGSDLWGDFPGWVPNEWQDVKLQQKWLLQRFDREDQQGLYCPLAGFLQELKDAGLWHHA